MSVKALTPLGTPSTEYLGAGAVYFNFGELDELCIGTTKGGSEFKDGAEFRQREADGDLGPVKGAIDLIKLMPQLTLKSLKIDKVNLAKFYAGMSLDDTNATYSKLTRKVDLSSSYLTNVAFVGQNRAGNDIIVIVKNALGDGALELAVTKDEELIPSVQFTGTIDPAVFDRADASTYPYQVWLQKAAGNTVTFTVSAAGPVLLEDATVTFNGQYILTDVDGEAEFTNVAAGTNVPYSVAKAGYGTKWGSVTVDGAESVAVTLVAD